MAIKQSRNAPTLVDVAREAGVSLKTASRVLNGAMSVKADKADKIREVMSRLGYRPNELARGLKARKSAAIGMIVPNLSDPFTASAVKAVQEIARANGYVVILASSGGYADVERSEIESLVGRQIDGLVIAPADSRNDNFSDIIPAGLQVVTFDQPIRDSRFDVVTIPNRRSAKAATQHLLDHGFRRVVAIGARPHLYTCSERIAGYRDALRRASLEPRTCLVEHESVLTSEWLAEAVFRKHKADAIICMNWVCTMLTLRGLRQLGKELGRNVPMLSFDDFELADMLTPSITAVRQPAERFGYEAARLLFERLNGNTLKKRVSVVLPTDLILRESCGCRSRS
jgi:LacI family transcriptional regulator